MIMNNLMLLAQEHSGFLLLYGCLSWNEMICTMHFPSIKSPFVSHFCILLFPINGLSYIVFLFHSLTGAKIMNTRMTLPMNKGLISKELLTSTNLVMMRIWKIMIYLWTCWDWSNRMKGKYYLIKRSRKLLIWGHKKKKERWKSGPHYRSPLGKSW